MNKKNKIQVSLGVLVIFAVLFSIVPAQAETLKQVPVITVPGANIYVDGVFACNTYGYYRNIIVPFGQHEIKVTKTNYYPTTKTVTIDADTPNVYIGALTYIR